MKIGRKKKGEVRKAIPFLLPSFAGIIVFVLIPFVDVIKRSFCDAMNQRYVGLENYKVVLENKAFLRAIQNTARFLATCIPLLLIVSLLLSLLLYQQKKYKEFFKVSFLLPMAIPVASVVVLWKLYFHENGLINVLLSHFDIGKINFMNSAKAFYIMVFSYIWKNAGYDMILWLTGLYGIDVSYYEAASVDGASTFQKFRYITLPNLWSTIFMISVLSFINSFKVFREAYLVAGDYPDKSIYMLQHLFNNWFVALDIQKMCAAAVMTVAVFIVVILLFKLLDKDEEQ